MNKNRWRYIEQVLRVVCAVFCGLVLEYNIARPTFAQPVRNQMQVFATQGWQETGIHLQSGDEVTITATGNVQYTSRNTAPNKGRCSPEGVPVISDSDDFSSYSIGWANPEWNHCSRIALVYHDHRLHSAETVEPAQFPSQVELVGKTTTFKATVSGNLVLSINDTDTGNNEGAFDVSISVFRSDRIGFPVRLRFVTESGAEIEELGIGGSFRVRVEFEYCSEPAGDTWPVTVRSPGLGEAIEVVAERTGERGVFLTGPIRVVSPEDRPGPANAE